jgi:hypothetical protein
MSESQLKENAAAVGKLFGTAAKLAQKQAALATLNNVTLPTIYYSIGKRLAGLAELPSELSSQREKIRSLEVQIAAPLKTEPSEATSGFAARAKQLAYQAAKATADAAATAQIHAAYVSLGKAAVEKYGDKSVPQEILPELRKAQAQRSILTSDIASLTASSSGGVLTPARVLVAGGVVAALVFGVFVLRPFQQKPASSPLRSPAFAPRTGGLAEANTAAQQRTPEKTGTEANPVPDWLAAGSLTAADEAVEFILGDTSTQYLQTEYKGVRLGQTFEEIRTKTPIAVYSRGEPFVYRDKHLGGYVFSEDGKLVCHSRSYVGGPEDYLDALKDLFGKTDKPLVTREQSNATSMVRRTYIRYTFPKTLAMVEFGDGAALTGGRARQTEATHVFLLDRQWAEDLLKRSGEKKEPCLYWMRQASQHVQVGVIEPASLPRLPDTRVQQIRNGAGVIYIDEKKEKRLKEQGYGGEALEQAATVARCVAPDGGRPGLVTFSFARYSGCEVDSFLKQEDNEVARKKGPAHAVSETPFLNFLESELNSALMQQTFRPRTDEIRFMQRERVTGTDGLGWYEWNHTPDGINAWTVKCGVGGGMELEYLGDRGL